VSNYLLLNPIQAAAFGLRSIVHVPKLQLDTVSALSVFCEKASMVSLIRCHRPHSSFKIFVGSLDLLVSDLC